MATTNGWASNDWMRVEIGKPEFQSSGPDIAMLPHQCDYWEIGDADDVRAMIKDLQAALKKLEAGKCNCQIKGIADLTCPIHGVEGSAPFSDGQH